MLSDTAKLKNDAEAVLSYAESVLGAAGWEQLYLQREADNFANLCGDAVKAVMGDLSSKEDTQMKAGLSTDEYSSWAKARRKPTASVQAVRKRMSAVTNKTMVATYRSEKAAQEAAKAAKKRKSDNVNEGPATAKKPSTGSSPSSA